MLSRQLFLRRHAFQLCLFEQPVLDIECFLLRQRDVFIHRLGAAHHLDRTVVKLRRDARFALILAPRDHSNARDQDHRGIWIAHRRRIRVLAALIIGSVVVAVLFKPRGELRLQRVHVFFLRVPVHVERLDLRAQKMVRAGGAELRQSRRVVTIHKTLYRQVGMDGGNQPFAP